MATPLLDGLCIVVNFAHSSVTRSHIVTRNSACIMRSAHEPFDQPACLFIVSSKTIVIFYVAKTEG